MFCMLFKTSLDKTATIITTIFTLLFAAIIAALYFITPHNTTIHPVYTTIILLALYCLAFAFHPAAYKVTGDALIVCRPWLNVSIKRTAIQSVTLMDEKAINGAVRTFGVGGLFGYYGCFANLALGSMTWYATRKDNAVLITTTNNKKIVITPNDTEAFIAAFTAVPSLQ